MPALAGASDVAVEERSPYVVVAARDADAIVVFERRDRTLTPVPGLAGCAAAAIAGCTPARALDQPVAVALDRGRAFVAARASDAVSALHRRRRRPRAGRLRPAGRRHRDGCHPGRALDAPQDVELIGDPRVYPPTDTLVVASAGSNGIAVLDDGPTGPTQPAGAEGCMTRTGAAGCAASAGLAGAARLAVAGDDAFVGAPGSGAVTQIRRNAGGSLTRVASPAAPTAALAFPPQPTRLIADAPSYAWSHLYAGGAGIVPFARGYETGTLSRLAGPVFDPSGAVTGLAVSGDQSSLAVYAAVPSANAVVAFSRNIPPSCGFWFRPDPTKLDAPSARVPVRCFDANGDPLRYSLETPPKLGTVAGFDGDDALYEGPALNEGSRVDSFTVRASDGGESALSFVEVDLAYTRRSGVIEPPVAAPRLRILDRRARMDRKGRIRLRVRCTTATASACRLRLSLRRRGTLAGRRRTLRSGEVRRIRIALPKRTRRAVRRARKGLLLTAAVSGRDGDGRIGRAKRRVRVRAAR